MLPIQRDIPIVTADLGDGGRTVVVRALPLDTPTRVTDDGASWYSEVWRPGAFARLQPHKTVLQRNHAQTMDIFGICKDITEDGGHVVATFGFLDGERADTARQLMAAGTWEGASVSVIMARDGSREVGGLVERNRVSQFRHLAIVDQPAYPEAKVVAVRHEPMMVAEYLARLGRARTLSTKRSG